MAIEKYQFNLPKFEEKILKLWEEKRIFELTLEKTKKGKPFIFYEGPPTANGLPGIHHVEARAFKDLIPRYKTMRGFFVARKAGWDTHGLPVEIQVEKELGLKNKQEIEQYGIAAFNTKAKESVWRYKEEWDRLTRRMGFWLDLEHPYITYDPLYIESLWWIIKEFWKKKLLAEDFKIVPWCTRCQTGLSTHELAQGYKMVKDKSIYVKFKLDAGQKIGNFVTDNHTYILAWTTTPWTLPGNVGLAVNKQLEYVLSIDPKTGEHIIVAKSIFIRTPDPSIYSGYVMDSKFLAGVKGEILVGLRYEPLFDVFELKKETAYKIYSGDFVTAEDGTGVVHTAVMYGEDDYKLGKKIGLPTFHTVDETGRFVSSVKELAGLKAKNEETEKKIIEMLKVKNALFAVQEYEHDYPHCWRCGTPILYYARNAWWVRVTAVKKELIAKSETINWVPDHLKKGRFGEFLKDVRDWAFSRERYWGAPLPIWKCEKCAEIEVIGSRAELEKKSGQLPHNEKGEIDLHRPYIDTIQFPCKKCSGAMRRISEVADVWFDSGAMPFAQAHYPFEQKEKLAFPADFICEAIDQTRGWFYTLLAVSTLLGKKAPYKNVISLGHVLDKNGQKMSKSKGNVVNPWDMIQKYGIDTLRWYFYSINAPGDPKRFDEKDLVLKQRTFLGTWWNSFVLFDTYVKRIKHQTSNIKHEGKSQHILDKWILAKLDMLVLDVTERLDRYDITGASRAIEQFIVSDFSQWYLRRSRERFQRPRSVQEKREATETTAYVLETLCRLTAPFTPFLSDYIYQELRKKTGQKEVSVHLLAWPSVLGSKKTQLIEDMEKVRNIITCALKMRAEAGIKVRQPLQTLRISDKTLIQDLRALIQDEVNVKEIIMGKDMWLDTVITPELREEGMVRELIRNIQEMRRELGITPKQKANLIILCDTECEAMIARSKKKILNNTHCLELRVGGKKKFRIEREINLDGKIIWVGIS